MLLPSSKGPEEPEVDAGAVILRTTQTTEHMIAALPKGSVIGMREEPRLAEQQFGNFQNVEEVRLAKRERQKFGRFFWRMNRAREHVVRRGDP